MSGEKKNIWLEVEDSDIKHPIHRDLAAGGGATVLISPESTGPKYIGIQTVMELSRELDPEPGPWKCDLPFDCQSFGSQDIYQFVGLRTGRT